MFFIGFVAGLTILFLLLPLWARGAYGSSAKMLNPVKPKTKKAKNLIVVSYSYIMPLAVMALLFSVIVGAQITKILTSQGHGKFVYFSLSFPIFGFLIGYLYFKRMVKP